VHDLQQDLNEIGQHHGARIKVSDEMQATLTSLDFEIQPETDEIQSVSSDQNTEWRWQIQPKRTGTLHLHLTLSAIVFVRSTQSFHAIRTFNSTFTIEVGWFARLTDFLGGNWQWLWTAILIPVAGLSWGGYRKRHSAPRSESPDRVDRDTL
jgi:hypothetical protein